MGGLISGLFGGGQSDFVAQQAELNNPITAQQVGQGMQGANQSVNTLQNLYGQTAMSGGLQNQSYLLGQQNQLAGQLQQQAMGHGPNPAMAQLAQQTGNNIQQQSAMMAGQRGAGANAGLIARQAAQQGGSLQQQAVGQGATLQAQQQLAAQQQLGQQQQAMQQVAGQQVGQQQQAASTYGSAAQGLYGQTMSGYFTGQGQQLQNVTQANQSNQATQSGNAQNATKLIGGVGNAIGGAATKLFGFAEGGEVPGGPKSSVGRYCKGGLMASGGNVPGKAKVAGNSYSNDTVKTILSPGEIVIPRSITQGPDAPMNAAKFVAAVQARSKGKG